jgi:hypothetical protein
VEAAVRIWPWCIVLLLVTACAPEPFKREPLPTLQNPDPNSIREAFAKSLPPRFVSDDTIIVHAPFHDDFAFLGVLRVDRQKGTFELAGLNHVGIKLFDLSGDSSGTTINSAVPPLMEHKDILLAMGADIRRMFFDLAPDPDDKSTIERSEVKFKHGKLIRKLGGTPVILLEKREDGFFGPAWRVQYFRYTSDAGRLYPRGLVMDNGQYHYRIVVKNRDIDFEQ